MSILQFTLVPFTYGSTFNYFVIINKCRFKIIIKLCKRPYQSLTLSLSYPILIHLSNLHSLHPALSTSPNSPCYPPIISPRSAPLTHSPHAPTHTHQMNQLAIKLPWPGTLPLTSALSFLLLTLLAKIFSYEAFCLNVFYQY